MAEAAAVDSIAADLAAAMDETPEPAAPAVPEPAKAEPVAPKSEAAAPAAEPEPAPAAEPVATETPEPAKPEPVETIEAPQHWPLAEREMFSKQPVEVQKYLLDRHKALEADYTKKTQSVAQFQRQWDQINELLAPHREKYSLAGMDDTAAVRQLLQAHAWLEKEPRAAIDWLAKSYGIDLTQPVDPAAQEDPAVVALRNQVAQLTRSQEQERAAAREKEQKENLARVTQFAEAKDAQGNLQRPYFDDVSDEIVALMKSGVSKDLQDAYDRAVYANPTTRAKLIAAEAAQRQAKADQEAKAKAEAAKRAGFEVTGQGGMGVAQPAKDNLRAELEAALSDGRV